MAKIPTNLRYSDDHEWLLVDADGLALIGITDHAQDQLGDIVYIGEFADIGEKVEQGDVIGVIESVKATSDIYAPISGKIMEVNIDLVESPESINSDPYEANWMFRMKVADSEELDDLFDAEGYEALIEANS